ncbi:MAG TPA: sn-glycerol-3-phosphate ABC transporter ATP-binding protein UgpC [Actinomycetota bacterium]|nr:sn-glycerol-3-phosphate ABC transporter ATP-binding protein UgpC [Actinomycetota bacterium]
MAGISLEGVAKTYPDGTKAVSSLDLQVPDGRLMVLVGPSGCGKTTILLMVAGLEEATEGTIRIGDRVVDDVAPMDRDIAMVFQNYALYPHMSVYQNMAFGLKMRKVPKREIDDRVRDAARILGLPDELLAKKPKNLSGGQRQRVAMGRAIVRQPAAFLMDEPLSNLDAALRVEMRAEISRIQRDLGVTTIYVTHDQTEAMTLGDLVACFDEGALQQVGPPQTLYDEPVNLFVAAFMGSPAMNLGEAELQRDPDGRVFVHVADHRLQVAEELLAARPAIAARADSNVILGIRPEDLEDAALAGAGVPTERRLPITVELREAMGSETHLHCDLPGWSPPTAVLNVRRESAPGPAEDGKRSRLVARVSPRSRAREGDPLVLAVDTSALHFFDPGSGARI